MKRLLTLVAGLWLLGAVPTLAQVHTSTVLIYDGSGIRLWAGTFSDPNSHVTGSVGDRYFSTAGTQWSKTSGANTTTGWAQDATVTSVGLSVPSEWTCTGSPVTSSGTITCTWTNPVSVPHGGTNKVSWTAHTALVGNGTGTPAEVAGCASGVLRWSASSADPTCDTNPSVTSVTTSGDVTVGGNAGTSNFASQTTGWRVSFGGAADFRTMFSNTATFQQFVTQLSTATNGANRLVKSSATLAATFTCPAKGSTATLTVDSFPEALSSNVYESGDSVVVQNFSRSAGAFSSDTCVGVVTSPSVGSTTQTWTFTRNTSTNGGTMATSTTSAAKSLTLDYGVTGQGFYECTVVDGTYGANSPYCQVATWATAPVSTNFTTQLRVGQLIGITGTSEYGLIAGAYGSTNGAFFRATNQNFDLHGVTAKWWDGSTLVAEIAPNSGSPFIGLGNGTVPTSCCTTAGVFLGWDHSVTKAKVSFYSGPSEFFTFDGSKVTWSAANTSLDGSGNLTAASATLSGAITATSGSVTGDFNVGTGGDIRSGATAFGTGTGWWLDYNSGTPRFRVGTVSGNRFSWDGTNVTLVSDTVTMDSNGIQIVPESSSGFSNDRAYRFTDTTIKAGLYGVKNAASGDPFVTTVRTDTSGTSHEATTAVSAAASSSSGASFTADAPPSSTSTASVAADIVALAANTYVNVVSGDFYVNQASGAFHVTSAGLLTVSGLGAHTFSAGGTGAQSLLLRNTTAGTGNYATVLLGNDASATSAGMFLFSSTFTTSGPDVANGFEITNSLAGGISIASANASGAIRFYAGGTTEAMRIFASRGVSVGDTTDPGGGNFRVAGHATIATLSDTIAGDGVVCNGSGVLRNGAATTCGASSIKFKEAVIDAPGLGLLAALRPVEFSWKPDVPNIGGTRDLGFIAEDTAQVSPLLAVLGRDGAPQNIRDRAILAVAVKAIQELALRVQVLEQR